MKLVELKPGDLVIVNYDGVEREGTVIRTTPEEENEICVNNGIQEFWYSRDKVKGIPVNEAQLLKLGFEKMESDKGAKYGKSVFRILVPAADNFSEVELWYREDHRHFDRPIFVHELQNVHLQMTKMPLEV